MYRYSKENMIKIAAARKRNKDKRAEKRLYALELPAEGKSAEKEAALLEPYRGEAEAGQIVEVSKIKARYEEAVRHSRPPDFECFYQ